MPPRTSCATAAKSKMKSHYRGHKMALWLHLIPQLHMPNEVDFSNHHHQFNETDLYNVYGKWLYYCAQALCFTAVFKTIMNAYKMN